MCRENRNTSSIMGKEKRNTSSRIVKEKRNISSRMGREKRVLYLIGSRTRDLSVCSTKL
jgi:hypothetical protein